MYGSPRFWRVTSLLWPLWAAFVIYEIVMWIRTEGAPVALFIALGLLGATLLARPWRRRRKPKAPGANGARVAVLRRTFE